MPGLHPMGTRATTPIARLTFQHWRVLKNLENGPSAKPNCCLYPA
jgi:hypothetical protein